MSNALKILVIDDSEDDRMVYRRNLKKSIGDNCIITEADSGEEGLHRIETEHLACVLLDYSMPGYNGVEILKRIRITHPFLPVVMLTGQGNEKIAVTAMQEGAQNYISKNNITPESLEIVVRRAIEHCILQRRVHDQRSSLEVFTRALAHDLKEPTRTICSYVEMIQRHEQFSEKSTNYFRHISNAAARMRMLIDTVFLYTRLDDPQSIEQKPCDVTMVMREVQENLSQLIHEHKPTITYGTLPEVKANRIQLIQLLQNLISNAITHSEKPVTVHIEAEEQAEDWLFRVKDNGPGIEEIFFQKIFEPFRRLTHYEVDGAGLGLAICQKIVESHGGRIWCESTYGKGATFLFTLPKSEPMAVETVASAQSQTSIDSTDAPLANVMLVDDSDADLMITRFKLVEDAGLNCNLTEAHTGEEALYTLRRTAKGSNKVDLMLLDINMPVMNGLELLEHIRSDDTLRDLPVIMCTGSTYDKDMKRAESLGVLGYVVKPIDFNKLKAVIDRAPHMRLHTDEKGYSLLRVA